MRELEALSDGALTKLAVATNVTLPALPPGLKPTRVWQWFGNVVAAEAARRRELNIPEPAIPADLTAEDLEAGVLVLTGMAGGEQQAADADPALVAALQRIAEGLLILRKLLRADAVTH